MRPHRGTRLTLPRADWDVMMPGLPVTFDLHHIHSEECCGASLCVLDAPEVLESSLRLVMSRCVHSMCKGAHRVRPVRVCAYTFSDVCR